MSLLPFLAVALGAGCLSLLTRRAARASAVFGVVGLVAAAGLAALIRPEEPFRIAGGAIAGSDFARLFLVLGSAAGLLLAVVAMATTWPRSLPGATLIGLGGAGFALGVVDPGTAVAAATSGAVVGVLVTVFGPPSQRRVLVAARELRALVVAGVLGLVAAGAAAGPVAAARIDPAILGLAYLGFASAVAIRFGAIPFHLWAARVAEAAPEVGLPLIMAWGPAAFAVVGLAWVNASVAPSGASLIVERGLIVAIGVASIALGTVAAFLHDDIEHVVGYSIVADGGIALLGLGALDQAAWGPTRMWLLALVVTKTAFAAWAAAVRATFGTGRIDELRGWAGRAPVLGLALVAIVLASVGWPGMAAFAARGTLVGLVLEAPLSTLLLAFALSAVLYYGRLAVVGLLRPGPLVAAAGLRPRPPAAGVRTRRIPRPGLRPIAARLQANQAAVAAAAVLVLSGLAVAVSGGGLSARAAADAPGPAFSPAGSPGASESPAVSASPAPSASPLSTATPPPSESPPSAAPTGPTQSPVSPRPSASARPSASPRPSATSRPRASG